MVDALDSKSCVLKRRVGSIPTSGTSTLALIPCVLLVSQHSAEMAVGSTLQLTALIIPHNASDKTVHWSSSDEGEAGNDSDGREAKDEARPAMTPQDGRQGKAACSGWWQMRRPGETRGAPGRPQNNPVLRTESTGESTGTRIGLFLWIGVVRKYPGARKQPVLRTAGAGTVKDGRSVAERSLF